MIRAFPYVPLGGQMRIGIAIFSYDGEVNFGITGDYDTTPDIDVLAGGIEDGMTQMLKVCDQPPAEGHPSQSAMPATSSAM
jgi:diacylglycerol O-acyltransferase